MVNETQQATPVAEPPESSPLWGVVLVLGEIAQRVEREQASSSAGKGDLREDAA